MELTWTTVQLFLLIAGTTLAQEFSSGFQSGFQPSFQQPQRFAQDTSFQQPQQRERPTRLLSQVPSPVRRQRPVQQAPPAFQQTQPTFQQSQPTFQQPQQAFQQQSFQPPRAPPPPPPQPQPQPQPQQQFFDQPEETFQQQPPQQQTFQQPQEPTFRQPSSSPSTPRRARPTEGLRATRPLPGSSNEDAETIRQQNLNAKYSFAAGVTDGISDNQHLREETRDGLALKGMYSYSDGYFRRTVHYEADENGYRVTNEEVEPIGNGPQEDPNGRADIELHVTPGQPLSYSVTSADFTPKTFSQQQPQVQSQLGQFPVRRQQAPRQRQPQQQQQQQIQQDPQQQFEQQQF